VVKRSERGVGGEYLRREKGGFANEFLQGLVAQEMETGGSNGWVTDAIVRDVQRDQRVIVSQT
jgi:hypothetical protein